ncbi:MAG: PIG-L deacetylase family protein [Candidatus Thorarchaeota archaeon]
MKRILFISPHYDDAHLGCGATMHRFSQRKTDLFLLSLSFSECSLPLEFTIEDVVQEVKEASEVLGIPPNHILYQNFFTRLFLASRQDILQYFVDVRKEIYPDIVFVPSSFDKHQDHKVVYEEARRAFSTTTIFGYEIPWNCTQFSYDVVVEVSFDNVFAKQHSLQQFHSQAHRDYFEKDTWFSYAKSVGLRRHVLLAEAFENIQQVVEL